MSSQKRRHPHHSWWDRSVAPLWLKNAVETIVVWLVVLADKARPVVRQIMEKIRAGFHSALELLEHVFHNQAPHRNQKVLIVAAVFVALTVLGFCAVASPKIRVAASPHPKIIARPELTPRAAPTVVVRYSSISLTKSEYHELASVIYLEARGEPADGQQAVAEVVLNRVVSGDFPNTVREVLHDDSYGIQQFSCIELLDTAAPVQAQYDAIAAALYGPSILPDEVVFFSIDGENDKVWGVIGKHIFCYSYGYDGDDITIQRAASSPAPNLK